MANRSSYARLKKRIVRTLINEVIAHIDAKAAEIVLVIHWMGGVHTELRLPRRRHGVRQLADKLKEYGVTITGAPSSSFLSTILSWVLPIFIFYLIWTYGIRRMADRGSAA